MCGATTSKVAKNHFLGEDQIQILTISNVKEILTSWFKTSRIVT